NPVNTPARTQISKSGDCGSDGIGDLANVVFQSILEPNPPTWPSESHAEQRLCFVVAGSSKFGHYSYAVFSNCHAGKQLRRMSRRFCPQNLGKKGKPGRDRGRFIVGDVVEPGCSGVNSGEGCRRSVVDVDERPMTGTSSHNGNMALPDTFEEPASRREGCARTVKRSITQDKGLHRSLTQHRRFNVNRCVKSFLAI